MAIIWSQHACHLLTQVNIRYSLLYFYDVTFIFLIIYQTAVGAIFSKFPSFFFKRSQEPNKDVTSLQSP